MTENTSQATSPGVTIQRVEAPPRSAIERHAQTVIASIILGLAAWTTVTVADLTTKTAVLVTRVGNLETRLADFRHNLTDRYRKGDAQRDLKLRDRRLDSLEKRMDRIEARRP